MAANMEYISIERSSAESCTTPVNVYNEDKSRENTLAACKTSSSLAVGSFLRRVEMIACSSRRLATCGFSAEALCWVDEVLVLGSGLGLGLGSDSEFECGSWLAMR